MMQVSEGGPKLRPISNPLPILQQSKLMVQGMRERIDHNHLHMGANEVSMKLDLSEVPLMFDDYQRLQVSFVRQQMHLLVKVAALIPDEAIEEDAEVSKSLKKLYEQVMNRDMVTASQKDLQATEFQERKIDEWAQKEL